MGLAEGIYDLSLILFLARKRRQGFSLGIETQSLWVGITGLYCILSAICYTVFCGQICGDSILDMI